MGTEMQVLNFESHAVRLRTDRNDDPWWIAADVCEVLGVANSRDAMARLDPDEKGVTIADTPGGQQEMSTINESGLYSLIMTSRKPEAKRFKRWVLHEVLPSIRKTGRYSVEPELTGLDLEIQRARQTVAILERQAVQAKAIAETRAVADRALEGAELAGSTATRAEVKADTVAWDLRDLRELVDTGRARDAEILRVNRSRSYRDRYVTFEDWCRAEHGISRSEAHRAVQRALGSPRIRQSRRKVIAATCELMGTTKI